MNRTPKKTGCDAGRCAVVSSVKGEMTRGGREWRFKLACGVTVQRAIHTSNPPPRACNCSIGVVGKATAPAAESERAA